MNPSILERYLSFSLIDDEIEVCFDDITSEQLSTFPRILRSLRLKGIKFWTASYEQNEFSKLGIRRGKARKDPKLNSESLTLIAYHFTAIALNVERSKRMIEFCLYGITLSIKTWICLGKSLGISQVRTLVLQKCEIGEKELECIFQHIGSMSKLVNLDLANNQLKGNCGYFIGRIISRQGERRDTNKWENELRGSTAENPIGLTDLYISNNHIADYGWEKIISSLVSDNWLRLIEAKNIELTSASYKPTKEALGHNKSVLVIDLRENHDFEPNFMNILEIVDRNFDYIAKDTEEYNKYTELFEMVCNEESLLGVCEIKVVTQAKKKILSKDLKPRYSNNESGDKINSKPYIEKISLECQALREENAKLRKKLENGGKRKKTRALISTHNIMQLAEEKLKEAGEVLDLVNDY